MPQLEHSSPCEIGPGTLYSTTPPDANRATGADVMGGALGAGVRLGLDGAGEAGAEIAGLAVTGADFAAP